MMETDVTLLPPNLASLGVPRRGDGVEADILTIWDTPYPMISRFNLLCADIHIEPFGGGSLRDQGDPTKPGYVVSGYRSDIIEGNRTSMHLHALALDFRVGPINTMLSVVPFARRYFTRVGLYPDSQTIHVDLAPVVWIERYRKRRYWIRIDGKYVSFDNFHELNEFCRSIE